MLLSLIAMPLLCALPSHTTAIATEWQTDYNSARRIALEAHKPLAVFVGEGADGWKNLSPGGSLDAQITRTLANGFVALYVDKSTDSGKALADVLDMRAPTGLVISDSRVQIQAFNHSGTVNSGELLTVLTALSAATAPVVTTESPAPPAPVATYAPAPAYTPAPAYSPATVYSAPAPAYAPPVYQGGGCPNGNCATGSCPNGTALRAVARTATAGRPSTRSDAKELSAAGGRAPADFDNAPIHQWLMAPVGIRISAS